jgi:hypothetical protein
MSIRVTLEDGLPQGKKIRVQLPPQAAEPPPPKVLAFWYAEDRPPPPWRYAESPEEQAIREQAERDGSWTG